MNLTIFMTDFEYLMNDGAVPELQRLSQRLFQNVRAFFTQRSSLVDECDGFDIVVLSKCFHQQRLHHSRWQRRHVGLRLISVVPNDGRRRIAPRDHLTRQSRHMNLWTMSQLCTNDVSQPMG